MISSDQAKSISLHFIEKKCKTEIKELQANIMGRAQLGYINSQIDVHVCDEYHKPLYTREMQKLRENWSDEMKAKVTLIKRYLEIQGFKVTGSTINNIGKEYFCRITFTWG